MITAKARTWILLTLLILAGCGVENTAGVQLATVHIPPTARPEPTTTPDPLAIELPNAGEKEFVGTTVAMRYPAGWETAEGGQSLTIYDPATLDEEGNGNSSTRAINFRIQLTNLPGVEIDPEDESVSPLFLSAFVQFARDQGFRPPETIVLLEGVYAFTWAAHDSAIYLERNMETATTELYIVVMDRARRRFITIATMLDTDIWADFEPTLKAIMGTVTLDGESLPPGDILVPYEAVATG